MSAERPQLHMWRSLHALPELVVPAGYALRTLRPGDIQAWATLLNHNGELGEWTVERAAPYFAPSTPPDSGMPLDGSFFLTHDGEPVATAHLHLKPDGPYAPTPELSWVAVSRAHRGRRLGSVVSLAVLRYAALAGHQAIYLLTDDHRLAAIKTYLQLGFEPWMYDPTAPERWRAVFAALSSNDRAGGRE